MPDPTEVQTPRRLPAREGLARAPPPMPPAATRGVGTMLRSWASRNLASCFFPSLIEIRSRPCRKSLPLLLGKAYTKPAVAVYPSLSRTHQIPDTGRRSLCVVQSRYIQQGITLGALTTRGIQLLEIRMLSCIVCNPVDADAIDRGVTISTRRSPRHRQGADSCVAWIPEGPYLIPYCDAA
jgi:hypothetical protein